MITNRPFLIRAFAAGPIKYYSDSGNHNKVAEARFLVLASAESRGAIFRTEIVRAAIHKNALLRELARA